MIDLYTFRNYCEENKELPLNDGTTKIFLSSEGAMNDVSKKIKAFLDYMKELPTDDSFVTEFDTYIREIKTKEEERVSYMTYEMKIIEAQEDGQLQATVRIITNMLRKKLPYNDIAETTEVDVEEVKRIAKEKGSAY